MIRYVAIGAVVGFLVAYFLLSAGNDAPPGPVPAQVEGATAPWQAPQVPHPSDLGELKPLPEPPQQRR